MKSIDCLRGTNYIKQFFGSKSSQKFLFPSIDEFQTFTSLDKSKNSIKNIENSKDSKDSKGIFWDKETVEKVWGKLKIVSYRVKEKKRDDHHQIKELIETNQDEAVLQRLHDPEFKKFYRNKDSLFPEDVFLELLVEHQKFDLLNQVVKDPCYVFNTNFIFKCISQIVNKNNDQSSKDLISSASKRGSSSEKEQTETPSLRQSATNSKKRFSHSYEAINKKKQSTFSNYSNLLKKEIIQNLIKYGLYKKESEEEVKIIGWIVAQFGLYEIFLFLLKENEEYFEGEKSQFNNFASVDDIANYGVDEVQFQHTIENCLKAGFEELAIFLCEYNSKQKEPGRIPNIAAETESMQFLQYLWEKEDDSLYGHKSSRFSKRQSKFYSIKLFNLEAPPFKPNFSMNSIIKILIDNDKKPNKKNSSNSNINRILKWENIERDKTFIDTLFQYECFDQISVLISKWPGEKFANPEYFRKVIYKIQTELILFYLKRRECKLILTDHSLQEYIVKEYMSKGELLYYGAEMLTYIYKNQWNSELTKELCKNVTKTIKTKDILNCHSSILTCLLLIEFLTQIKTVSLLNLNRCDKLISDLKEYCKTIQECNHTESYISYLMKQKDTRKRSAFNIVSENALYSLLETPEVGTIVKKMWNGTISNNGFFAASSIHRFLFDLENQRREPFHSFDTLDVTKVYYFQLAVWLDSCSMRYNPIGLSSIALVAVYNLFIFFLNDKGDLMNNISQLSDTCYILFIIYMCMVHMLIFTFFNQLVFFFKTKRPFKFEPWDYLDFLLFIFAWLITVDTKKFAGDYSSTKPLDTLIRHYIFSIQLPFVKELQNETEKYSYLFSFILRVSILAINDILVWGRVTGVLLTYKEMGPVMRMIFSMGYLLIRYIIIIAMFLALCAGVFTSLFNRYSEQFVDFSTSVVILFGGFLNDFNATNFKKGYTYFGSVLMMVYVCISAVLFVNLLIAVLSNVYEQMAKVVDASYRAIIIQYYRKFKWDQEYGYLLFLTSPFNIINIPCGIINAICCVNQKTFNKYITRILYMIFYFPIIIGFFILYTLIMIPFAYIKGNIIMFKYQQNLKILVLFKILNIFKWLLSGIFFLIYIFLRDIVYCFFFLFNEPEKKKDDFQRVRENISNRDVVIFLKFIHSNMALENSQDIHTLFMSYLDFEASEKTELNDHVKKAKEYMKKLGRTQKPDELKKKSAQIESKTVMLYNNLEEGEHASAIYTKYIRKNLMIIEILENFLIEDDNNNGSFVDIDKMRKLLPKTMTIKNYHLRRLIHSDIHGLSQAMLKLKASKNAFWQYQLMNRIMSSAQRLDKEIDSEIYKIKRRKDINERLKSKKSSKKSTYKEKLTENQEKKEERIKEVQEIKRYEALISSIRQSIIDIMNSKKPMAPSENSSFINESTVSNKRKIEMSLISKKSFSNKM